MTDLKGRRALVTGGSRGIGKGIAQAFLEAGALVAIVNRSGKGELTQFDSYGESVQFVQGDITDTKQCEAAVQNVCELFGGLDVLVNCGGRIAGSVPDRVMTALDADVLADFDEKVLGTLRMVRSARSALAASGSGRVINVGGAGARHAGNVSSGARNAALVHLSKSLAMELGQDGITVNTIHPGLTLTETVMERLVASSKDRPVEGLIEKLGNENAIRRLVTPADIGAVAAFLASVGSGGLTGEVLCVTGGSDASVYY